MDDWIIWLIRGGPGRRENFTSDHGPRPPRRRRLLAPVAAALGLPSPFQLLVFTRSSPRRAAWWSSGPSRCATSLQPSAQRFGVAALVGKPAYVLRR